MVCIVSADAGAASESFLPLYLRLLQDRLPADERMSGIHTGNYIILQQIHMLHLDQPAVAEPFPIQGVLQIELDIVNFIFLS